MTTLDAVVSEIRKTRVQVGEQHSASFFHRLGRAPPGQTRIATLKQRWIATFYSTTMASTSD